MDIRHFRMIQEVTKQGNLTRAADNLYVSQSALSHQLKEVESFFNTQIFIRQKKQMVLTGSGKIILDAAEKILEEIENTKRKIHTTTDKNAGEIRLSTECYTAYHWLSRFLTEFNQLYPKVDIRVFPESTYDSSRCLVDDKLDIGIVDDKVNNKLNYAPLFTDEFMAIFPEDHPWAVYDYIKPEDFYASNYIMFDVPDEVSTVFKTIFKEGKPKKVYKVILTEAVIQMVKAGLGVAILPNWIVKPYLEANQLTARRVTKKGMKRTWYAATLKNKQLPPYINVFIRTLSKHLKQSEELAMFECV